MWVNFLVDLPVVNQKKMDFINDLHFYAGFFILGVGKMFYSFE